MKKLLYDKGEKSDIARLAQESVRHDEKKLKSGSSIPLCHTELNYKVAHLKTTKSFFPLTH